MDWTLSFVLGQIEDALETYQVISLLLLGVVEEELREVGLWVVGLDAESLRQALRKDLSDIGLLKVGDLRHVAAEKFVQS